MKAISLWQPWASAVADFLKRNETRGRLTHYRGPIAIHAAKRWEDDQVVFCDVVRPFSRVPSIRPLGAIVCLAHLWDCRRSEEILPTLSQQERAWGNYGPGRYAWLLRDVIPLTAPLPWAGKQGFFEVPDDLLRQLAPAFFKGMAA